MQNKKIAEMLHKYFELGVAEGREGRNHDTQAGDAQRVLSEIEAEIAALTATEPQPTPSVAVKALEWETEGDPAFWWFADQYKIERLPNWQFRLSRTGLRGYSSNIGDLASLSAAKSAAQADYEARIRSALSAQVQAVADGKELGRFELWFFHHLTDDQRTALFALNGYPTTGMDTHGKQKIALKHWFSRLPAAPAKQER